MARERSCSSTPRIRASCSSCRTSPQGKGNAVREGFRHVSGEIILIQDADGEYSVDDYAGLIEPIMKGEADFTLGCRHVPGKPIRVMHGKRAIASVVNAATGSSSACST